MSAVITRTRRPISGRIAARFRSIYLRWLIRHAEKDLAQHQAEFDAASRTLPAQIKADKEHIAALTRRLTKEVNAL
jgi:hypothetical protein